MSDVTQERPRLRPSIDVAAHEQDGQQMMVLYDGAGLSVGNIMLTPGAFFLVTLMNGENTLDDICTGFTRQFGQDIPPFRLAELLHQLDRHTMLEGPVFEAHFDRMVQAYREAPARPSSGDDEDVDVDELRAQLVAMIDEGKTVIEGQRVVGLIAPHLDYERGRPCYAETYAQLRGQDDVDRFVILGSNHFGRSSTAVWTVKDYATPFGVAETDRAFIDRLRERCGADLGAGELDHLREHSVELQVTVLQAMAGTKPVRIVPLLCPDVCGPTGLSPYDGRGPGLDEVATALADVIAESPGRTCVIAGADLSHVGRRFGDEFDLDNDFLEKVQAEDRALLSKVEAGDAAGLIDGLVESENLHRVCSSGCLYVLLRVLEGSTAKLLRYHQAVNAEEHIGVTCASAVLTASGSG